MRLKITVLALLATFALVAAIGISPTVGKMGDKVTGGGYITSLGNKSNFGFNAMNKSSVSGTIQYNDHAMGIKAHGNVTTLTVTPPTATFGGTVWINGTPYPYTATVTDGSPDTFSISIPTFLPPYANSGNVTGQIKIH